MRRSHLVGALEHLQVVEEKILLGRLGHSLNLYQYYLHYLFFQPMIKESFLRNYSLSKIYSQAEDEKKKLKVFYIRKVNKILKEKQQKERQADQQRRSQDNKQLRMKERQLERQLSKSRAGKSREDQPKEGKISKKLKADEEETLNSKQKTHLRVTEVRFLEDEDENTEIERQTWRLKTTLNKSLHIKRPPKKNTFCQSMYPLSRAESNLQVFTKSINHSRHESDLSNDQMLKNRESSLLNDNQIGKQNGVIEENRKQQKAIAASPLKMNCTFRRSHKKMASESSFLGCNLHFHKIL